MSVSQTAFEAWALPTGVPPPGDETNRYETDRLEIRYPRATSVWMRGLTDALLEAREPLLGRRGSDVAHVLGKVGSRFLDPDDPVRLAAVELLPPTSGLSPQMAEAVLDGMASDWSPDRLERTLKAELGDPEVLDGFIARAGGHVRAIPPRLCTQILSGSVPGVGVSALLRSLMVKAPTLLKPGRGDVVLPTLFARALREEDPELAAAAAVLYWPGGHGEAEEVALGAADVVTAYGDDRTILSLRARVPVTALFVPYHHRVSFAVVGRGALQSAGVHRAACDAAGAVAFFDQRGCVSPQVIYVEDGAEVDPRAFAAELADALGTLEERLPAGTLDALEASAVHQVRGTSELREASGEGLQVHHGGRAFWTVIYDPAPGFEVSCIGRVVRVKPVDDIMEVAARVAPFREHLQTVGVTGCDDRLHALAETLADAGVTRVAPLSEVPFPPPWWHHDGRGPLRVLLRWVDLET